MDRYARLYRHAEQIGQVVLALRIGVGQCTEPRRQITRRQTENAGIHLGDLALFICRIFFFDVTDHVTRTIPHDTAIAGGVGQLLGYQPDALTGRLQQRFKC